MALATARLVLRPWRDDDLPAFARLNADERVMEFMLRRLRPEESDAMAARIRRHIEEHGWGFWAVEAPGIAPFVGFVGLASPRFEARFTPCVEIGWRLAHACWGRGFATEAARAALAYGFGELGLAEIVAFTAAGNRRSQAVMERLGMRRDPGDDFGHPAFAEGHPLRRHVLYRLARRPPAGRLPSPGESDFS